MHKEISNKQYISLQSFTAMLSKNFLVICINIMMLSQTAKSLVLFTANMEDIKKIAQKFLSEPLADQIAQLIAKVGTDKNVSEENERNADDIQNISNNEISNEDKNNKRTSFYEQIRHNTIASYERETRPNSRFVKVSKIKNKWDYRRPKDNININPYKSHLDIKNMNSELNQPVPRLTYKERFGRNTPQIQEHPSISRVSSSEVQKPYRTPFDNNPWDNLKRIRSKYTNQNNYRPKAVSLEEFPPNNESDNSLEDFKNLVSKKESIGTTRKERNEFDQYDNTNYPKASKNHSRAGLLATSGPVELTKSPTI